MANLGSHFILKGWTSLPYYTHCLAIKNPLTVWEMDNLHCARREASSSPFLSPINYLLNVSEAFPPHMKQRSTWTASEASGQGYLN